MYAGSGSDSQEARIPEMLQTLPRLSHRMETLLNTLLGYAQLGRQMLTRQAVDMQSLLDEAIKIAATIAAMSLPSVLAAKEAVNRAFESSQAEGIRFERRVFHSLFATRDQQEGMTAFIEKRPPKFENK